MAEVTRFQLNQNGLNQLLFSPSGPVARDMFQRGIRVQSMAKVNASGRPGPNVRTGLLRSSIRTTEPNVDQLSIYVDVGSDVYYSSYVEKGTDRAPAYPYLRPAIPAAA